MRSKAFTATAAVVIGLTTFLAVALASAGSTSASPALKSFYNGFETNTDGWCDLASNPNYGPCDGKANGTIDRVMSGFSNYALYAPFVGSSEGKWHARVSGVTNTPGGPCVGSGSVASSPSAPCAGPYTDWEARAKASSFPSKGFTTSLDIYLDTTWASSHPDIRFDWDTALNDNKGNFLQDYVFNAGTSPTAWPGGTGFVVNASTNADRSGAFPENPCPSPSSAPNTCRVPVTITTSGWYSFVHHFYVTGGNLAVQMTIVKVSTGKTVPGANWTIYPGQAISGVGGPYAGYFPNEEILGLPIDRSMLKT